MNPVDSHHVEGALATFHKEEERLRGWANAVVAGHEGWQRGDAMALRQAALSLADSLERIAWGKEA